MEEKSISSNLIQNCVDTRGVTFKRLITKQPNSFCLIKFYFYLRKCKT